MAEYEDDQIEFAILGLVREPLIGLRSSLLKNIRSLQIAAERLNVIDPTWCNSIEAGVFRGEIVAGSLLLGPDTGFCVDQRSLDNVKLDSQAQNQLNSESSHALSTYWRELAQAQSLLRLLIKQEQEARQFDEEKAARRRHDYGCAIYTWLRYHSQKKLVKKVLDTA